MAVVRVLLPTLRPLARISPGIGGPLLGSALLRCHTPPRVLLRPPPTHRRLAWCEEAVRVYRRVAEIGRPQHQPALARALALYGHSLRAAGRYEESLAAVGESLSLLDHRTSETLTAFVLNVRALCLANTNRLDEALAVAEETVERYRHTTPTRRERRLWNLPGALLTYGWLMGALGRREESVTAYRDCIDLLRKMSLLQRSGHQRTYASVLVELVGGLRSLGRFEEAIEVGAEAPEQIDAFVRFYPQLAHLRVQLLTHLAWCHSATGDTARAREAAEESVVQCRRLAASDPATGEPQLALALDCLAYQLGRQEVPSGERLVLRELVGLYNRLAADHPDVYEPQLASALDSLASRHWRDGAWGEAVAATEQSVEAYRRATRNHPQAYEPELARVLARLSERRLRTGPADTAVANAREALAITRRLSETDWDTYQALTAERLRVLARALRRAGDLDEALACHEEAVAILESLMEDADSGEYEAALSASLSDLATTLRTAVREHIAAARMDGAVSALRRLIDLTRRTDQPDVHAICHATFAYAREQAPTEIRKAWQQATSEPFPSFLYTRPPGI